MSYREMLDVAEGADLLLNISGHLTLEPLMRRLRRKAYLDLDPGYTQFWYASGDAGARCERPRFPFHDRREHRHARMRAFRRVIFAGATRASPSSSRPTPAWSRRGRGGSRRSRAGAGRYGPVRYGSTTFGLKVHEFRKFIELPQRTSANFEVALDIHPADGRDLDLLRGHGWRVVDPRRLVPDPRSFDDYILGSDAEWSAAQGVYVATNSGWFSDRTVRYLAAGKPALVQDTGFSRTSRSARA